MGESDKTLYIVQFITSALSAIFCFIVLVIYCYANSLRNSTFKIVFYLSLHNFIKAVVLLVPGDINKVNRSFCYFFAYVFYGSSLASIIWTFAIALHLYTLIILKRIIREHYFKYYIIIGSVFPHVLFVIPWITGSYGQTQLNCLIVNDRKGNILRFSLYYFPALFFTLLCIYMYFRVFFYIRNLNLTSDQTENLRLIYFPIILIVCIIPMFIYRSLAALGYDSNLEPLNVITVIIWGLHGFFDAVAYAFTRHVFVYMKKRIGKKKENTDYESGLIEFDYTNSISSTNIIT